MRRAETAADLWNSVLLPGNVSAFGGGAGGAGLQTLTEQEIRHGVITCNAMYTPGIQEHTFWKETFSIPAHVLTVGKVLEQNVKAVSIW